MNDNIRPIRATGMSLRLSSCALAVDDLDQTLAFYRDVLGFEVNDDAASREEPCRAVAPPQQPDMRILLVPRPTDPPTGRWTAADDLVRRLVFATDDCDAVFERLEAAGAEVMQEPIDRPGIRDCAFLDPSGNLLRFTQATCEDTWGASGTRQKDTTG
ncbi:VOC family protein [Actinocorallia aurantiaca]|uniref:VOC family protein n=1 Tax=Actinocorallia aurantiaca TaxID=46204 RepID=A0ABN3UJZ5_9ACTN